MKKLTKTEQTVLDRVNYTPICGKFTWNYKTNKYDQVNPEWIKRCRARIQKLIRENNVQTPAQLLKQLDRKARIEGESALKAYKDSPEFKKIKKLPPYVRVDVIPEMIGGKRLSTSYIQLYRNKQGKTPDYIRRVIADASFDVCDWGRLRKIFVGENRFHCQGIRTKDNGKYGIKKAVWHYADYYIAVNRDVTRAYYKLINGETGIFNITRNGSFKFDGRIYRKPRLISFSSEPWIKPHHIRRSAEKVLRGNIRFEWDRKEKTGMFVDNLTGEQYHFAISDRSRACRTAFYEVIFRDALHAFRVRRKQKALEVKIQVIKSYMMLHKESIFVGIHDSTKAGNCEVGTLSFARKCLNIDTDIIGGVTVGRILEQRNDTHAIMACVEATKRFMCNQQLNYRNY